MGKIESLVPVKGKKAENRPKFWASSVFHIRKILSCNTENSRVFLSWMELLFLCVTPSYLIEIGNYIKLFYVSFSSPDIHREIPLQACGSLTFL